MTPRRKRLFTVLAIAVGVSIAVAFAVQAFRNNMMLYFDPSEVVAGQAPQGRSFRIGGMVTEGSVVREPGSLEVKFVVTDYQASVPVSYTGVLPDLFGEGQGVVAHGKLNEQGVFVADEVLAKHDENYMPPEVAESLKKNPPPVQTSGQAGQGT